MSASDNPYVGPRPFSQADAGRFFGREREARELTALVVSQRLTLFYAQSGAGKSSLLNARLIPTLQAEGFVVLPVGRVGGALPDDVTNVANIFVYNLVESILHSGPAEGGHEHIDQLTDLSLARFLAGLTSDDGGATWYFDGAGADAGTGAEDAGYMAPPTVLVIDQFEELLTYYPERWEDRADFFRQVDAALRADPRLWVVLTLREDYAASLDPYIPLVENRLRARYFMPRMGVDAALAAVREPAQQAGRTFAPGVAEWLVENLSLVRAQAAPGGEATAPGEFVEPVQLQVVCYQWWESLPSGVETIELAYVEQMMQGAAIAGFVDQALADFYERVLGEVLALHRGQVTEPELRAWFSGELITEARTRGLLFQGDERTGSLPNAVVRDLEARFVVRAVARAGGLWYELVHDRFVEPILAANLARQTPLRSDAEAWLASGRDARRLYGGQQLWEASAVLEAQPEALSSLEQEFIRAGVEADAQRQRELAAAQALAAEQRERAEEQAAYAAQLRTRNRWFAGALIAAVVLLALAVLFYVQSQKVAEEARISAGDANTQRQIAQARLAQFGRAIGSLGIDQLLAIARELNAVGDMDGAKTLLQTAAEANPNLVSQINAEGGMRDTAGSLYSYVPGGLFLMGSNTQLDSMAFDDETPQHSVDVAGFWIMQTEVTNAQYANCVQAGACSKPENTRWNDPFYLEHPVTGVSWFQANDYAKWVGGRLPTEAEWEKACRGTEGRIYPWGDDSPSASRLNYASYIGDTTDAGSYPPGANGLYDMAGNVWEWTADWYGYAYYQQLFAANGDSVADNPTGPEETEVRTLRGGSWFHDVDYVRCAVRDDYLPRLRDVNVGFRVVSPGF